MENVEALPTGDRKEETLLCPNGTAKLSGPVTAKTALVLAGGGITGFLYEVGVLTALDEVAGRAASSEFDAYIGISAGAVLAALLANGARAREIFKAIDEEQIGSPFYFQSRDILGVAPSGPLGMIGQFARAIVGTMARAIRANQWPSFAIMLADFQEHHPPGFYSTEPLETTLCDRFYRTRIPPPVQSPLASAPREPTSTLESI